MAAIGFGLPGPLNPWIHAHVKGSSSTRLRLLLALHSLPQGQIPTIHVPFSEERVHATHTSRNLREDVRIQPLRGVVMTCTYEGVELPPARELRN